MRSFAFGPWADGDAVKSALLEAGAEFGIRLVGGLAYITNALESGWIPRPLPAIYSDDPLLAEYRKWLAATGDPVIATVGGSLAPADVTGYYFTPFELGYGKVVKFNHDFIGREALERAAAERRDTARSKVTLVWNADDAAGLAGFVFQQGPGAKILNLPMPLYATFQFDRVLAGGKDIGRTAFTGYSANERAVLALATVDSAYAEPGTEVTVLWGESPNTAKPTAEPHVQVALRAIVQSAPITDYARTAYRAASA